ncbi:MAG: PorT family protein [Fibrobacter sp.]|nr:PorT family protein [Fibrobacter sp.]
MNIRFTSIMAVLATAASVFAAEPEAPAAESAAPAAVEAEAPAAESVAPAAVEAEAPAAESAPVVEAPADEASVMEAAPAENAAPAPVAVRGGSSYKTYNVESRPATAAPAKASYVQPAATDRGYEPQKLAFGVQAFVGSFFFMEDVFDYDMSGMTWRVGLHTSIPLNTYTSALKVGLLFEHSEASTSDDNWYSTSSKISQYKLNIPVLFDFKGPRSIVSFGIGTSVGIPLSDTFSYMCAGKDTGANAKHTTGVPGKHKFDMIEDDQRVSVDWNLLLGLSIRPNNLISFDIRYELGMNKLYEDEYDLNIDNSSSAFTMGLSFYIL